MTVRELVTEILRYGDRIGDYEVVGVSGGYNLRPTYQQAIPTNGLQRGILYLYESNTPRPPEVPE